MLNYLFTVGGVGLSSGRPCSPQETGGTLQWGGSNCRHHDRSVSLSGRTYLLPLTLEIREKSGVFRSLLVVQIQSIC